MLIALFHSAPWFLVRAVCWYLQHLASFIFRGSFHSGQIEYVSTQREPFQLRFSLDFPSNSFVFLFSLICQYMIHHIHQEECHLKLIKGLLLIAPKQFLPVDDLKLLVVYIIWPNLLFTMTSSYSFYLFKYLPITYLFIYLYIQLSIY